MPEHESHTPYRHQLLSPAGYVQALAAHARLIMLGALLAAIAGGIAATVLPERFSSSATLLVSPPPFKSAEEMSMLMPAPLGVPDYRLLLTSDGILMRAAEIVKGSGDWDENELSITALRNAMSLSAEVSQKTVSVTAYSPIIILTANAGTAEKARDLVNAWAQVCEEISREAYEKSKTGLLHFMEERFTTTQSELTNVSGKIRDMEIAWNDELAKAQLAKLHTRYLDYQEKIIDRKVQIETTRKEIAELEKDLATESPFITLQKSPPMETIYLSEGKEVGTGYTEQQANLVYMSLKEKVMTKRSEMASMEEYVRQMESQLSEVEADLQAQREELATKSYERKMLNLAETPQMRSYDLLSGMLEQAKFVESDQMMLGDIKLISEAVLPDRKSWPPRTLFVIIAGFCGFCVAVGAVLLRHALHSIEFAAPELDSNYS